VKYFSISIHFISFFENFIKRKWKKFTSFGLVQKINLCLNKNKIFGLTNSNETDNLIKSLFTNILQVSEEGSLDQWEQNSNGALALVILFDQISKKIYRGTSKIFSNDA
jgi:uncharacterized protein (DUF924 family)